MDVLIVFVHYTIAYKKFYSELNNYNKKGRRFEGVVIPCSPTGNACKSTSSFHMRTQTVYICIYIQWASIRRVMDGLKKKTHAVHVARDLLAAGIRCWPRPPPVCPLVYTRSVLSRILFWKINICLFFFRHLFSWIFTAYRLNDNNHVWILYHFF